MAYKVNSHFAVPVRHNCSFLPYNFAETFHSCTPSNLHRQAICHPAVVATSIVNQVAVTLLQFVHNKAASVRHHVKSKANMHYGGVPARSIKPVVAHAGTSKLATKAALTSTNTAQARADLLPDLHPCMKKRNVWAHPR